MPRKPKDALVVSVISRDVLETVAKIIGPYSGAAQALDDAATHDGPVNFYQRD